MWGGWGVRKKKVIERSWISSAIQTQDFSELMRGAEMSLTDLDKLVPITAVFPVFNLPGRSSKSGSTSDPRRGGKSLRTDSGSESRSCSNTRREVRGHASVGIQRGMEFPRSAEAGTRRGNICEINYK